MMDTNRILHMKAELERVRSALQRLHNLHLEKTTKLFGTECEAPEEVPEWLQSALASPAGEPVSDYRAAYEGAREDLAIWKKRALEAEKALRVEQSINDNLVKELGQYVNGPTYMGEPAVKAQPAPATEPDPLTFLAERQEPLGAEFAQVLHDNLDHLYVTAPAAEPAIPARRTFTDLDAERVARAFWRRIQPYVAEREYARELPYPCPVEFAAHMSTALLALDLPTSVAQSQEGE